MLRSVRGQKEAGVEEGGEAGVKMVSKKEGGEREVGKREADKRGAGNKRVGSREMGKGNKATGDRIGKGDREGLRKTNITSK